ncbi:MAG: DUF4139 domain-containing protein [Planctomycetes bacterium]|nr:DUF4139 domain-containing protein [Planctomycetota bacterium]MCB9935272.1 DUF4139 domain-containing protein [Planctomycetota bacterium]
MFASSLSAKEELVTLPERDSVQLTIYNSEDLTLVRERRTLSFKQGNNRLQFSWANTLIDPTSVEFEPVGKDAQDALEVMDVSYPAESHEMLIWTVACSKPAGYEVEISYFTSGISWSAEYTGMVNAAENAMDLTAYVTVTNNSGEEYEDAEVRLVVGVIHLVERIIDLARPRMPAPQPPQVPPMDKDDLRDMAKKTARGGEAQGGMQRPKEIQKAGLSEYYIYTVEGTETIPHSWSKRLRSFEIKDVPLKTVYRLEPDKHGPLFTKVLEFKNDEAHKLGKEPLPDGLVRLYKRVSDGRLGYMGAVASKYIPKNEEVKVNVGPDAECTMKEKRGSLKKKDLTFRNNRLVGWTTVEEFETEVKNFRNRDVEVEIHRSMQGLFEFESDDAWERHDADTRKIHFTLKAGESRKLSFKVTTKFGENAR